MTVIHVTRDLVESGYLTARNTMAGLGAALVFGDERSAELHCRGLLRAYRQLFRGSELVVRLVPLAEAERVNQIGAAA